MKGKQEGRGTKKVTKEKELHGHNAQAKTWVIKKKKNLRGVQINFRYFPVQYLEWQEIVRKRGLLIPFHEEDPIPNY